MIIKVIKLVVMDIQFDIEITKQLTVFKGHKDIVMSIKYGLNESGILVVQIQYYLDHGIKVFICGIFDLVNKFNVQRTYKLVYAVKYSPFAINNNDEVIGGNSNVIYSGDEKEDDGIFFFKFASLKKKVNNNEQNLNYDCG
ncbi:hypothetical protein RFI_00376, partial [Reticulomyxa filosa]